MESQHGQVLLGKDESAEDRKIVSCRTVLTRSIFGLYIRILGDFKRF